MQLIAASVNYLNAPVALRERLVVGAPRALEALPQLAAAVPELAVLSTCNRTEFYGGSADPHAAAERLVGWLAAEGGMAPARLREATQVFFGRDAVRHAFRVASGLASMVPGEPHILGQMKQAAQLAQEAGTLGTHLHQLFQRSFAVAKEVRSRTGIGRRSVSFAAAAVRLAEGVLGELSDKRVLLVGAGKMIELAAAHFAGRRPRAMAVANRTLERAEALAGRFGARALPLAALAEALGEHDVVVCGSAGPLPLIGPDLLAGAGAARAERALLLIDLAVPRDVDPAVGRLPGVLLYGIDDLGELVRAGQSARHAALAEADRLVEARVAAFMRWHAGRQAAPLLRELVASAERARSAELERAQRRLARGEPLEGVLADMARRLSNKLLHMPRAWLSGGMLRPEGNPP
jgi:glutamyl-tRNA reductase